MNIKKFLVSAAAGTLILGSVATAAFAVGANGSFENGTDNIGGFITLTALDTTNITNWSVDAGGVDYIGTYWTASKGERSVDMNSLVPGTISQTFPTTVNALYKVTFDLSGNPVCDPGEKVLGVSANGATPQLFSFNTSFEQNTQIAMGWKPESYTFTATGTNTKLSFSSESTGACGPALDNVVISETLPGNKEECKKDGWKTFGVFKNQGDCVSFVATGGKNLPANP